jgi:methionyl aminopeptidase
MSITIKTKQEIADLKEGGKILREALNKAKEKALSSRGDVSTLEVSLEAEKVILSRGAEPAFKNYSSDGIIFFPETACVSLNDEIVHGIPLKNRFIKPGDIVKIDVGVKWKNLFTDAAISVIVGKGTETAKKIVQVTRESLEVGLREIKAGKYLGDYGEAVDNFVHKKGFYAVRGLVGHGVGHEVHEAPQIPNYGKAGTGLQWKEGMVIALEPMVNEKSSSIKVGSDQTTFLTKKGGLSAHFEDTVAITKNGFEFLTR